jgi:hypothetical protein
MLCIIHTHTHTRARALTHTHTHILRLSHTYIHIQVLVDAEVSSSSHGMLIITHTHTHTRTGAGGRRCGPEPREQARNLGARHVCQACQPPAPSASSPELLQQQKGGLLLTGQRQNDLKTTGACATAAHPHAGARLVAPVARHAP